MSCVARCAIGAAVANTTACQPVPAPRREAPSAGLTLVELTIVIALITIVSAIAIPGLAQARISANETSAIGTLKTLTVSNIHYRVRFGAYPSSLNDLFNTGYVDSNVASPFKAGYNFSYVRSSDEHFEATAEPTDPAESGVRYFFVDESGVIRFSVAGPADDNDPPL